MRNRIARLGAATEDGAPWPHRWENNTYVPVNPTQPGADNPPALGPAGTVHVSIPDWISFLQVFLGGGPSEFLQPATLQEIMRVSGPSVSGAILDRLAAWMVMQFIDPVE